MAEDRWIRTPTPTRVGPQFSRLLPLPRLFRLSLPLFGLHGRIRTFDILIPSQGLYQTELRTDCLVLMTGFEPALPGLKGRLPRPISRHQHCLVENERIELSGQSPCKSNPLTPEHSPNLATSTGLEPVPNSVTGSDSTLS